ncbi:STAS domain-containing protein [Mesobacillus sp. LC4]
MKSYSDAKIRTKLHEFFQEKTWALTEEWYDSLNKTDPSGVYSSTDPEVITTVKQQNHAFHLHFCNVFITDHTDFVKSMEKWVHEIAQDPEHLNTPIHYILREFFNTQEQYLKLFDQFSAENMEEFADKDLNEWRMTIIRTFKNIITWFAEEYHRYSTIKLQAQQETIKELSSPIITVGRKTAILPLIGVIDTERARVILENTLSQCSKKDIDILYIDLSGVMIVDTMVAQQIFHLINALNLIGVTSILSGIRPEVAQTAVQLGIDFKDIIIKANLKLLND